MNAKTLNAAVAKAISQLSSEQLVDMVVAGDLDATHAIALAASRNAAREAANKNPRWQSKALASIPASTKPAQFRSAYEAAKAALEAKAEATREAVKAEAKASKAAKAAKAKAPEAEEVLVWGPNGTPVMMRVVREVKPKPVEAPKPATKPLHGAALAKHQAKVAREAAKAQVKAEVKAEVETPKPAADMSAIASLFVGLTPEQMAAMAAFASALKGG